MLLRDTLLYLIFVPDFHKYIFSDKYNEYLLQVLMAAILSLKQVRCIKSRLRTSLQPPQNIFKVTSTSIDNRPPSP